MGRQSHSKRQKLGKALEGKASGTERKESDLPERHVSERSRPGYRMCALQERRRGGEAVLTTRYFEVGKLILKVKKLQAELPSGFSKKTWSLSHQVKAAFMSPDLP